MPACCGTLLVQMMKDKLVGHEQYIAEYSQDMPKIRNWKWNEGKGNF